MQLATPHSALSDTDALQRLIPEAWHEPLNDYFKQTECQQLIDQLRQRQQAGENILPPQHLWFNALSCTPFDAVKVVILGQDPYPTLGHAHGLAFSVDAQVSPLPKSLQNINKELASDMAVDNAHSGDLHPWAAQGVLLLNSVLTVEEGHANAHQNLGWEALTDVIIAELSQQHQHLVFILWGAYAQKKGAHINEGQHCVITSPHPSPLSAYRGFFGSRPFSRSNEYLRQHGKSEINWQL